MTKKTNHYIDNKQFLQALIDYRELADKAEEDHQYQIILVSVSIRLQNIYQENQTLYHTHFVMR